MGGARRQPGQDLKVINRHGIGLKVVLGAPDRVIADFFGEFGDAHFLADHFRIRQPFVQIRHHDHVTGFHGLRSFLRISRWGVVMAAAGRMAGAAELFNTRRASRSRRMSRLRPVSSASGSSSSTVP